MRWLAVLLFLFSSQVLAQSNSGELHVKVVGPTGEGMVAAVRIVSEANQYRSTLMTDEGGKLDVQRLPYGRYRIEVDQRGFAPASDLVAIRSALPVAEILHLKVATVKQTATVNADSTLIDLDQAGAVDRIGAEGIEHRVSSIPGRSLQDLVNSQPGWLYEGNAVLHPRGSEYQTQFVVNGIPLTDNRSPSFGPEIEADDVQSMSIYTAGIPAEYGRKMGGVVEVNTIETAQPGLHGEVVLSGGSFDTAAAFAKAQYGWRRDTLGGSASGSVSERYLNPVVPENYSNTGTLGDFSVRYQRQQTDDDRFDFGVRHEFSRYDIPNEQVQESAGQRQTADNLETMGTASYEHDFSSRTLMDLRGMVRDNANDFNSNAESTPIEVLQHNRFREGYVKATATAARGRSEWKLGVESDNTFLHEDLSYSITDATQFDAATPAKFAFSAQRPDLEQAAFAQDRVRLGDWTIDAGLRWDHYQLLLNKQQVQPRFAVSRAIPAADLVLHFSYDRVFQTPSSENILLSSSAAVESLDPNFVRLPVQPSVGDYYEGGLTKSLLGEVRLDANIYRRFMDNYADDSQIENTTISFPIAFRKGIIYGAEGKLEVPDWRGFSGFLSYSYAVGNAWFPVTGGLFLGGDATAAEAQLTGHTPDSQDQRNTVRGRVRYQVKPRFWVGGGVQYDSGLPFDFDGDPATVAAEYGQPVLDRINFTRGRIDPALQISASAGAEIYESGSVSFRFQADGENLTNTLDVLDFGGLFSGNAIGPPRSFALRLMTNF